MTINEENKISTNNVVREELLVDDQRNNQAGKSLSWGAILAGVMTFFSLFILLSFIGSAIGFGTVTPTSDKPFEHVGAGLITWTILTFLLSFLGAGFVSGATAKKSGYIHGFLTWAASFLLLIVVLTFATVGALSNLGSLFGNAVADVGDGITEVVQISASGVTDLATNLGDEIDTDNLSQAVKGGLKETDIPELQPDYLKKELNKSTDYLKKAGKQMVTEPENSDQAIDNLSKNLENQVTDMKEALDKEAVARSVAKNTDLTEAEAKEAVSNIMTEYDKASSQASKKIEELKEDINQLRSELDKEVKEARETAEDASNTAAKMSGLAFVAAMLALILTSYAGMKGASTKSYYVFK